MKVNINILKIIVLFSILGCASSQKASGLPEWVKNPSSEYHQSLYISAVGSGSSRDEAKRDAITSLSNIFSVNVKVDRRIVEAYTEEKKEGDIDVEHSFNLLDRSALISDNRLINVREGETYFDEKTGTFYMLVYINRGETEPMYLEEIRKNDRIVEDYYLESKSTDDRMTAFINLKKALQFYEISEGLRQIHRIITQMDDTPEPPITRREILRDLNALSEKIIVTIKVKGDYRDEISSYLNEVIQETGFFIGGGEPDLSISAVSKMTPMNLPREEEFVRWRLTVNVNNAMKGKVMDTFTREGREGHATLEAAENRALMQIKEMLMDDFYMEFNEFLVYSTGTE